MALGALAGLGLGCAARTPIEAPTLAANPLPPTAASPYRLMPGDVLTVKFWANPELDETVTVRPDGRISLPFVDEVDTAGLSPAELDGELTRRYTGELARPEITVIVREFSGQRIFIGGEVETPGMLALVGPVTLVQAIQQAGGFQTTARRRQVLLIRTYEDGNRYARSIDIRPALAGSDLSLDVRLQASDIILVPRTKVTNVNLFVQQYFEDVLPIQPILTLPLTGDPLFGNTSNGGS